MATDHPTAPASSPVCQQEVNLSQPPAAPRPQGQALLLSPTTSKSPVLFHRKEKDLFKKEKKGGKKPTKANSKTPAADLGAAPASHKEDSLGPKPSQTRKLQSSLADTPALSVSLTPEECNYSPSPRTNKKEDSDTTGSLSMETGTGRLQAERTTGQRMAQLRAPVSHPFYKSGHRGDREKMRST